MAMNHGFYTRPEYKPSEYMLQRWQKLQDDAEGHLVLDRLARDGKETLCVKLVAHVRRAQEFVSLRIAEAVIAAALDDFKQRRVNHPGDPYAHFLPNGSALRVVSNGDLLSNGADSGDPLRAAATIVANPNNRFDEDLKVIEEVTRRLPLMADRDHGSDGPVDRGNGPYR